MRVKRRFRARGKVLHKMSLDGVTAVLITGRQSVFDWCESCLLIRK